MHARTPNFQIIAPMGQVSVLLLTCSLSMGSLRNRREKQTCTKRALNVLQSWKPFVFHFALARVLCEGFSEEIGVPLIPNFSSHIVKVIPMIVH